MADFNSTDILIPKNIKDNWAVIACDQFTSDKNYWNEVKKKVGNDNSTLNLILPEIFLDENVDKNIKKINQNMYSYLDNGVFQEFKNSMIFVSRTQNNGIKMDGIIGTVNLDDYDYHKGAKSLTRATEQTVVDRIPPRVAIRKDAPLEFPHILLLIDDPEFTVIEQVETSEKSKIYDIDLMMNGGNVKGYLLNEKQIKAVQKALCCLKEKNDGFLFAVGDGNHSLATAKECAALSKSENSKQAMVEIVNIHSPAIQFEPIYRVLFGCNPEDVLNDFINQNGGEYSGNNAQSFIVCFGGKEIKVNLKPTTKLPVGTLQSYLDQYLIKHKNIKIDYIHGISETKELCKKENTIGFIFDGMSKNELFEAVNADGSLPRKTFSMGHAEDKRYYIESRKIR